MDNSFASPNNNQNPGQPSFLGGGQPNQAPNPQTNLTFGPDGRPTTGVKLETPILTPTQPGDNLRNYNGPWPMNQPQPNQSGQPAQNRITPVQAVKAGVNGTSLTMLSIVLGILAIVGISLGVFGLVDSAATGDELATARAELATKTSIVAAVEKQTGTKINSAKDIPTYVATTGYIYLTEWGIKIQIPNDLHHVSYILNDRLYHPTICFNAVDTSVTNPIPAFADVTQNPGGMGCLVRISADEGDRGTDGLSFGEKVLSDNGFNYFYTSPKTFSTENADLQLERHAISLIKTMLDVDHVSAYH